MKLLICALALLLALPGCASQRTVQCNPPPPVPAWIMEKPTDLQPFLDNLVTPISTPQPSQPTSR